jgi:hypothetical protein
MLLTIAPRGASCPATWQLQHLAFQALLQLCGSWQWRKFPHWGFLLIFRIVQKAYSFVTCDICRKVWIVICCLWAHTNRHIPVSALLTSRTGRLSASADPYWRGVPTTSQNSISLQLSSPCDHDDSVQLPARLTLSSCDDDDDDDSIQLLAHVSHCHHHVMMTVYNFLHMSSDSWSFSNTSRHSNSPDLDTTC